MSDELWRLLVWKLHQAWHRSGSREAVSPLADGTE